MALRFAVFFSAFAFAIVAKDINAQSNDTEFDQHGSIRQRLVNHAAESDLRLNPVLRNQIQDFGRRGCWYANQARARHGRHQLYYSASLTDLAARHSNWMAYYNTLRHQNLNGLGVWVSHWWLPVTAENIAMSTPRSNDPSRDAHELWYYSRGHFLNMISSRHTHCGVGIVYGQYGRWWATQLFGYSVSFGDEGTSPTLASAPAPAPAPTPAPTPTGTQTPASGGDSDDISVPSFNLNPQVLP